MLFVTTEIYIVVSGSLNSYCWLWKSTELFLLHCLQGQGLGYKLNFCEIFQNNQSKHNWCEKFYHRNFCPTRTTTNNQLRQRHLSSLYTIKELCVCRFLTADLPSNLSSILSCSSLLMPLLGATLIHMCLNHRNSRYT